MTHEELISRIFASIDASEELARLSNRQLVAQCLKSDAADSLIVQEMMNRLDPQWSAEMRITE
jgi:hypothetical protein